MKMDLEITGILFFAITFAVLGLFLIFLHIPKTEEFKYYKQARRMLGIAFLLMTVYCGINLFTDTLEQEYTHQCLLILSSLIFSWLNYSTFITLIYTTRRLRRKFLLDGIIPISAMTIFAVIGFWYPQFQYFNYIIFGVIFGAKCAWMAYVCLREYRRVMKDLENNYDQAPDIKWMRSLIWLTFLLSAATLVAFYVPDIHLIYDPSAIAIYVFMTVKMVNYVPKKISRIRQDYVKEEEEEKREEKERNHDLKTKLDPIVNEWVQNKSFLQANISIKHVAMEMGTNQNYLSRYINSVHEKTFSVWINTLRIEESKKILTENTSLSVEEVGQRVGIPQIYNFSRWFKTITGETPVQYRKSNSNR